MRSCVVFLPPVIRCGCNSLAHSAFQWEERPDDFCRWSYPVAFIGFHFASSPLLSSSQKPPQYLLIPFIESADNPTLGCHYGVGFRASQWATAVIWARSCFDSAVVLIASPTISQLTFPDFILFAFHRCFSVSGSQVSLEAQKAGKISTRCKLACNCT